MLLHFGPQHPSTHGVFRMDLLLDGEIVVKATPYVGYLHRAVEKLCEKLTYTQMTPIVDKNDYVAPMTNEQALVMAFEKLLASRCPGGPGGCAPSSPSSSASRRTSSGSAPSPSISAARSAAALRCSCTRFRERELILDLFEDVTGARFHYNTHTIGGNRHDLPAGWDAR